jgi:hypothetical protein
MPMSAGRRAGSVRLDIGRRHTLAVDPSDPAKLDDETAR